MTWKIKPHEAKGRRGADSTYAEQNTVLQIFSQNVILDKYL